MTTEELESFLKTIIEDIKGNKVTYVGDDTDKMCTIGNVSKVIINYVVDRDNNKQVFSILVIKSGKFQRIFSASPLKNYIIEIEKLCSEKGIDENIRTTKKTPRIR